VRSPEDYLQTLLRLVQNPLHIQKMRMSLWKSTPAESPFVCVSCVFTSFPEIQSRNCRLFDNLRIVTEVEVAARIAVDVASDLNCSSCMHIVISSTAAK
jgi:hypothetical protein